MIRCGMRLAAMLLVGGVLVGLGVRADGGDLPDDLARVPAGAKAVVTVRVAELWNGDLGKDLRAALGKELGPLTADLKKTFGADLGDVERVTFLAIVIDQPEEPMVMLRFTRPLDRAVPAKVVQHGEDETIGGVTVRVSAGQAAFLSADRKTFVGGAPPSVRKLLTEKPGKPAGALASALALAGKHPAVAFADPSPVAARMDGFPPRLAVFKPLLLATGGVAWADLGYSSKVGMKLTFKDDKAAARGQKTIDALRALASLTLSGGGEGLAGKSKPLAALLSKVEKTLDDGTVEQRGTAVEAAFELKLDRAATAGLMKEFVTQVLIASTRARSANNLKQIGIAMHSYHDAHNAMPPQAVYDKDGKALLSWRVMILPYVEQDALYKEFRLDEPWDSDHNKKLIPKIPPVFVMPLARPSTPGGTFYQAFHGKTAFFEAKRATRFADVTDGLSNTIMVTEAAKDVPWTKPDDLPFDPDGKLPKLGGTFGAGFHALLGDGSVRFLKSTIKPETLKLMIMRNDGMPIPLDD